MKLNLIKLGGSLITNKSKPFTLKADVLTDLVSQIKKSWNDRKASLILAHGSGSYGHVPAEKYKTILGKTNSQSIYGAAVVEDAASQLNRIVVAECLKQDLPAITVRPYDFLELHDNNVVVVNLNILINSLKLGFLPVVYGDVVLDSKTGFTIWSTEKILNLLATEMMQKGFTISKVIHCGETDGFLIDGKVVEEITTGNFDQMRRHIHTTAGFDVTGGMLHKIEEALFTAKTGIDSYIIGGNHGGNLYKAIMGEKFIGTKIKV